MKCFFTCLRWHIYCVFCSKFDEYGERRTNLAIGFLTTSKEILEEVDDVVLLEFENDNILDSEKFLDDGIVGVDGVIVPKVEMKFKDETNLYNFYKRYAYNAEFLDRKKKFTEGWC